MNFQRTLTVDLRTWQLTTLKKVLYRLGRTTNSSLSIEGDRAVISFAASLPFPETFEADFNRDLLDQDLRERIAEETGPLKNLILAQVFSKTNLLDPDGETGDFQAEMRPTTPGGEE